MVSLQDWLRSFWLVLTKPTQKTFESISKDVKDIIGNSIAWITLITVIFYVVLGFFGYSRERMFVNIINGLIFNPIYFLLFVFFLHRVNNRLFSRDEDCYDKLLFNCVIIIVLSVLINMIPLVFQLNYKLLNIALIIYPLILLGINVKAVTNLSVWQATINVGLSLVLSFLGIILISSFLSRFIQLIPYYFMN